MVITVSSVLRKEESPDVDGGGSTVAVGYTYASAEGSPKGGGLDASPVEDSTLGCLELAFNWAALCLRKVAPIGPMICTGSNAGKSSKPKSNRILWIKTGKNKPWDLALLLWKEMENL